MFSNRFQRQIVISAHAAIRMKERDIGEAMLLEVVDLGETRYKDASPSVGIQGIPGTA